MTMTVKELLCEQIEDALELQTTASAIVRKAQRQIYRAQRISRTIKEKCPEVFSLPVSSLSEPITDDGCTGSRPEPTSPSSTNREAPHA